VLEFCIHSRNRLVVEGCFCCVFILRGRAQWKGLLFDLRYNLADIRRGKVGDSSKGVKDTE
jgi:hypothetical protein